MCIYGFLKSYLIFKNVKKKVIQEYCGWNIIKVIENQNYQPVRILFHFSEK